MKISLKLSTSLILSAVLTIIMMNGVFAQHNHKGHNHNGHNHPHGVKKHQPVVKKHKADKRNAIKVLKKTNVVINSAYEAVQKSKNNSGNLSKAVAHQKLAKKMLNSNRVHKAVNHSKVARVYAFKAIRLNRGEMKGEWNFTKEENITIGNKISDSDLEKELSEELPNSNIDDTKISDKEMSEIEVLETAPEDYKTVE